MTSIGASEREESNLKGIQAITVPVTVVVSIAAVAFTLFLASSSIVTLTFH